MMKIVYKIAILVMANINNKLGNKKIINVYWKEGLK